MDVRVINAEAEWVCKHRKLVAENLLKIIDKNIHSSCLGIRKHRKKADFLETNVIGPIALTAKAVAGPRETKYRKILRIGARIVRKDHKRQRGREFQNSSVSNRMQRKVMMALEQARRVMENGIAARCPGPAPKICQYKESQDHLEIDVIIDLGTRIDRRNGCDVQGRRNRTKFTTAKRREWRKLRGLID
ncbi:hypothetical protein B0H17DRAFT_1153099 [Mycena rosella]|uniref:Uncharacterized protein n=1 Tax=Mycena rosella TaxID=1033263 RepID=A0AAD7FEC2_MYCRO|nr:hypothetical protein B0H17DRAFT_1153099 [Mycena rosella]